ncbi:DUF2470 domain-containing protein [Micromonospora carbonacea]|uniref:DUF2470 domain-containing protein n=1 Tax=Micromonospora carbonacea TaxID=47853 RepID=A0A1C4VL04_9ACTN|nr:DUF2470 domain-containing protein [Micromonospora carbonacea]SCE84610.1 Protein of unknown function (DUF2470) [Micromonospora carbonacea]
MTGQPHRPASHGAGQPSDADAAQPFDADTVRAVCGHMNADHADDSLLICRALGGRPNATRARATGLDADGMDFAVAVDGIEVPVRIPFARRISERAEIRREVVRMHEQACDAFGLPPRSAERNSRSRPGLK